MKAITLLLLLLFSSLLYGQEISNSGSRFTDFETSYVFSDGWEAKVTVGEVTYQNKVGIYQTMVLATIVQQWKEYQTECYADSTVSYYYTLCDWDCWKVPCKKGEIIGLLNDNICPEHWTHREPTPIGFMEYLTKKLENNGHK